MTTVRTLAIALLLASLMGVRDSRPARAQTSGISSGASCPDGNLLAGRRPTGQFDVRRNVAMVTDGVVTPEGAIWDASLAVVLDTSAATLTYDLGVETTLEGAYVQADANDTYTIFGSSDGQTWRTLGQADTAEGHGLRGRRVNLGRSTARFVRFGEGRGDGFFSLSELQLFCRDPNPVTRVEQAPVYTPPKTIYTYWNDTTSARWELVLALLGLGLLYLGSLWAREGRPNHLKKWRDRALAVLGVVAALTYVNLGFFHFGNYLHNWEWFHYFTGSKYFRELGYFELYECASLADAEDGLLRRVELRKITNLRTNVLEKSDDVLAHPERCKASFTPERWQAFKKDVAFFRSREASNPKRWDDTMTDHGYNATPVWNVAGSLLSNLAPASLPFIVGLSLLDLAYYLGMIGVIWWAFGWRTSAVALLVFATNFPSRFYWTGGAFLRWDWIFYSVASVACLKKEKYLLGGMAIAYATMLRIFPGLLLAGPLLAFGYTLWKERRLDRRWVRFAAGGALAVALLFPISLAVSGGIGAYKQFVQNTIKHKETPLTNYMGLRTVMAYRPKEVGRYMRDDKLTDPWQKWKTARLRAFQNAKPAYALVVLAFLALLLAAVKRAEPWVAAAAGAMFIAVGVELTSYYYAFLVVVVLLHAKRPDTGWWLLLCTAFTGFIAWAPLPRMSTWIDEQYTLMSAGTIAAFVAILWMLKDRSLGTEGAPMAIAEGPPGPRVGSGAEASAPSPGAVPAQRPPQKKKKRR